MLFCEKVPRDVSMSLLSMMFLPSGNNDQHFHEIDTMLQWGILHSSILILWIPVTNSPQPLSLCFPHTAFILLWCFLESSATSYRPELVSSTKENFMQVWGKECTRCFKLLTPKIRISVQAPKVISLKQLSTIFKSRFPGLFLVYKQTSW